MAEATTGLRGLLSFPRIYDCFQNLVGARRLRDRMVRDYVQATAEDRILDIGCGTGEIVELLPPGARYDGFDLNERYVQRARDRYGTRGRFECRRVSEQSAGDLSDYSIILAFGILHHLDPEEARQLFSIARRALRPAGRLITIDPCYAPGQSRLSRFLVSRDRGRNVLDEAAYAALARPHFDVTGRVHHDLIHIPYTHFVMVCRKA